ncbi:MAG: cysteine desulfurase [Candidatus Bathyarchaeota archaeon]|nr:cysteine desulfurase [Candidatus Bathyarchaeota archaeon]MDH5494320.1 cysteine desulfurase [Candidatus Bathyarchaeota archaeon]
MRKVYVDYAATTSVDPRVVKAMQPYFTKFYGNASSLNSFGVEAKKALETSRETIARFMGADANELIFTGSATEANNLVLKGHAFKKGKARCHIAVSTIDHDCILNSAKWLEKQGFKVTYLPVDQYGLLKMDALEEALKENVTLVSVVHGNNEIGTVQSIEEIVRTCHEHNTSFHTDAVQSFGKLPINVKKMNIDFMTINAHKLYGPKGVGALYINKNFKIEPLIHGGGHEFGLRSGTENVPGIVGFAKAVELRKEEMKPEAELLTCLRDKLIKGTLEIEDTYLNGHPTKRLSNNTNFRFSYIEGEAVVLGLDTEGIAASSGSACSSMAGEPSHVLLAIGLKPEEARGSLRLSLGKYNTEEDIDYILQVLPKVVKRLRAMSPLRP